MPENYIAMFNAPDVEKAKKIVAAAGPDIAKAVLAIKHGAVSYTHLDVYKRQV